MKRRNHPSRLTRLMDSPAVEEVFERMAQSALIMEIFRCNAPVCFWGIFGPLIMVELLPVLVALAFCPPEVEGLRGLLYVPVVFFGMLCGMGLVNMCMPFVQKICEKSLKKEFPDGLSKPLYLGHGFTVLFLLGFGDMTMLFVLFIML